MPVFCKPCKHFVDNTDSDLVFEPAYYCLANPVTKGPDPLGDFYKQYANPKEKNANLDCYDYEEKKSFLSQIMKWAAGEK